MKKRKGYFITFEGGEGVGKTTLIDRLEEALSCNHQEIIKTRAPGGTLLGKEIREWLLHHKHCRLDVRAELLLFLADRAQHVHEVIVPALEEGKIVLCDRFNDSTVAYQGVARGFSIEYVRSLTQFASYALVPDVTFYLDLDPVIGLQRRKGAPDRIESEEIRFHEQLRGAYQEIVRKEPARCMQIDASLSKEEVFILAKERLDAFFQTSRS